MVPQSGARPHFHSSDWLGQRPLHSAMGQEEAIYRGSLHRNFDWSGTVSEWISDWWVVLNQQWCLFFSCTISLSLNIYQCYFLPSANWYLNIHRSYCEFWKYQWLNQHRRVPQRQKEHLPYHRINRAEALPADILHLCTEIDGLTLSSMYHSDVSPRTC